jgi:hypothetical protein
MGEFGCRVLVAANLIMGRDHPVRTIIWGVRFEARRVRVLEVKIQIMSL